MTLKAASKQYPVSLMSTILLFCAVSIVLSGCQGDAKKEPAKADKAQNTQSDKASTVNNKHLSSGIAAPPYIPTSPKPPNSDKEPLSEAEALKAMFYDVNEILHPELLGVIEKAQQYNVLVVNQDVEFRPDAPVDASTLKTWLRSKQKPAEKPMLQRVAEKETDASADDDTLPSADDPAMRDLTAKEKSLLAEKDSGTKEKVMKPDPVPKKISEPEVKKIVINTAYLKQFNASDSITRSQLCELYASIRGLDQSLHEQSEVVAQYSVVSGWEDAELIPEKYVPVVAHAVSKGMINAVFKSGVTKHATMTAENKYRFHPSATVTRAEALRFVMWISVD